MTRIRFEDLPSTNTPINAENLNKLNNVIVSSEEPTTGEEVWLQKGNNLIDLSLFETKTVNDVTFTNNGNGTITINGIANGAFGISFIKLFLKAGIYSFNSNSNENMYLYDYDTNTNILSSGGNATFNQDYNNVGLDMYIEQGTVFSNVLVSPMLNMGSQLPFEKYIDKKIYVQNDNGVYEEFYNEENGEVYSTSEQRIGTWLGKPLYRKVIQTTLPTSSTSQTINVETNIETMLPLRGFAFQSGGTNRVSLTLPYVVSSGSIIAHYDIVNKNIVVSNTVSWMVNQPCYIILEYTKTTD